MRELGVSDKYFYYTASGPGATMDVRLTVKFKAPVNLEALLTAANESLRLFPEFSVRTVLNEGRLFYEENHNPVALLPSENKYDFGTDDMNGHLFCIQSEAPNEATFSMYHGLSDWNGLSRFIKTIICRYAVHVKGFPDDYFRGVIRSEAPDKTEWMTQSNLNPYETYARLNTSPRYSPEIQGEIFSLPEKKYDIASQLSRHYRITLSKTEFMKSAKSHNTSFAPYLLYIVSVALREAYDTDKNILLALPVDLRNVFKSDSIVNFSDAVILPSSLKDHSAPIEEQCRRIREIMTRQMQPENYAGILHSKVESLKSFESAPEGIIAKSRELTSHISDADKSVSLGITYLGIMDMPEGADDLLENIIMEAPFGLSYPLVSTYRDEMSITSIQRYDSDKLVKSICRKLNSFGLETKVTNKLIEHHNIMNIERLKSV